MEQKYSLSYQTYDDLWTRATAEMNAASAGNIAALETSFPGNLAAWVQWMRAQHAAAGIPNPLNPADPDRPAFPMIEYLWSYWMEQAKLFEIVEQICARYTNLGGGVPIAPELRRFDVSPLHTVAQVLWGYSEDMMKTKKRQRTLEYMRQYGLQTTGGGRLEAEILHSDMTLENRTGFLKEFHHLLNVCSRFYKELDDNTVTQDARPVLNALKSLNFTLSEGFQNQYMLLASKVRKELIVIQSILSFPEVLRFLGGRVLTAYPVPWMGAADVMRRILNCNHTPITEFYNLAHFGEIILLAVRSGPFGPTAADAAPAEAFAVALRNQVQSYIHGYQILSGVNLASESFVNGRVDDTQPSVYLRAKDAKMRSALLRGKVAA